MTDDVEVHVGLAALLALADHPGWSAQRLIEAAFECGRIAERGAILDELVAAGYLRAVGRLRGNG